MRSGYKNLDTMEECLVRVIESSTTLLKAYINAASILNSDTRTSCHLLNFLLCIFIGLKGIMKNMNDNKL
ncbi:MAG: hypothetical protein WD512_12820 [Candidatus Paceibacterota bacterium]